MCRLFKGLAIVLTRQALQHGSSYPACRAPALQRMPAQASLFTDKAKLFPRSAFVIGYDTAVRLVAPRYYARTDGQPGEDTMEMLLEARLCFWL